MPAIIAHQRRIALCDAHPGYVAVDPVRDNREQVARLGIEEDPVLDDTGLAWRSGDLVPDRIMPPLISRFVPRHQRHSQRVGSSVHLELRNRRVIPR